MEEKERLTEAEVLNCEAGFLLGRILEFRFRGFDVPVAEVVPDEGVERLGNGIKLKVLKTFGNLVLSGCELSENSLVVCIELGGINTVENLINTGIVPGFAGHLAEAGNIPELGAEVAASFDASFVKANVEARRGDAHDAVAESVRSVLGDEV